MTNQPQERRINPRLELRVPVRCQRLGNPAYVNGLSEDISLGGTAFNCDKFIAPKTTLRMEITMPARTLYPIGVVCWTTQLPRSIISRHGVEFLEFDLQEKKYLRQFLDMHFAGVKERKL
jgi:hypothetical protein